MSNEQWFLVSRYHIVQGQFTSDKLVDEMIYTTVASSHQLPYGARINIYNHTAQPNVRTVVHQKDKKILCEYREKHGVQSVLRKWIFVISDYNISRSCY